MNNGVSVLLTGSGTTSFGLKRIYIFNTVH